MHPLQERRLKILNALKDLIAQSDVNATWMSESTIISYLGADFGVSESKAKEYLKSLIGIGFCIIGKDGNIYLNKGQNTKSQTELS